MAGTTTPSTSNPTRRRWQGATLVVTTIAAMLAGPAVDAGASGHGDADGAEAGPAESSDDTEQPRDTALAVGRIAGASRYETAVAIASRAFPDGAPTIHLARADDPADALAAAALDGPVLPVPSCDEVPDVIMQAIEALGATRVVALGGPAAICDATLAEAAGDREVGRLAGSDRSATSAAIALAAFPDGAEVVHVVGGRATADALAAGALRDGPLLLTPLPGREVPDAVLRAVASLDPGRVVAVGGPAAVPDEVLATIAGDRPTERLAGPDRWATASAVAARAFPDGASTAYLAREDDPVDAVAGHALGDGPILPVPSCGGIPAATRGVIAALGATTLTALGGERAVCPWALDRAAGRPAPAEPTEALATSDVDLLASRLAMAERSIRAGEDDPAWLASMARWQHAIYRRLTVATDLRAGVLERLPADLRAPAAEQVTAAAELRAMVKRLKDAPPDTWRIVAPAPLEELRGYYLKAQDVYGVPWPFLAAINLVETRFGKIDGTSSAGARGPMQFMPGTWDAYGEGDVDDPHDAIMAAARYLRANGAPARMDRALWHYNHDDRYVRAVTRHANLLAAAPNLLAGYHQWEVWYLTTSGDVLLPIGWEGA